MLKVYVIPSLYHQLLTGIDKQREVGGSRQGHQTSSEKCPPTVTKKLRGQIKRHCRAVDLVKTLLLKTLTDEPIRLMNHLYANPLGA